MLAQGVELRQTAREQFVPVRLMPHVPQDPVTRALELGVQRDAQFDRAEARPEVAAGLRHRLDDDAPHLLGDGRQRGIVHVVQRRGAIERGQLRISGGEVGHVSILGRHPPGLGRLQAWPSTPN